MCANFLPAPKSAFNQALKWPEPGFDYPGETYVGYIAPIRVLAQESGGAEYFEAQLDLIARQNIRTERLLRSLLGGTNLGVKLN